jgi:putative oxidoreductase
LSIDSLHVADHRSRHTATGTAARALGRAALTALLATDRRVAPLLLRLTLAAVFFPHGAQKAFGWFGGYGFEGTMGYFAGLGIPAVFGLAAIAAELVGPIALALGLGGRVAAAGIGGVMAVAAAMVHLANGFFMDWGGQMGGEGYEYHLLALGIAAALTVTGSGAWSVDRVLARRLSR